MTVRVSHPCPVSGDPLQSFSLVKIQKGSSELHHKLSLSQHLSVGLETLKQNFRFIQILLEASGFISGLLYFAGTGLFKTKELVLELL